MSWSSTSVCLVATAWKRASTAQLKAKLGILAIIAAVLAAVVPFVFYGGSGLLLTVGLFTAFWLMGSSMIVPFRWLKKRKTLRGYPLGCGVADARGNGSAPRLADPRCILADNSPESRSMGLFYRHFEPCNRQSFDRSYNLL